MKTNNVMYGVLGMLVLSIVSTDLVSAYSLSQFGSDVANRILPYMTILFVLIGFPIGVGFAWKHVPGVAKIGLLIAVTLVSITAPMALPDGYGESYRDLWNKVF